jgi:hypothetical protein
MFQSPFLSGIKLVSELRLHIVFVSMAVRGHRAQAMQNPAVPERNRRNIELKNLRKDVQQLQLCLEHFAASEHDAFHDGSDVEDHSHELIDWNSPPTFDEDLVESYLPYDQKEEPVANWFTAIFYGIYPQEEKPFEEVNL